mgnify:CR=1 FL=1
MAGNITTLPVPTKGWPDFTTHDDIQDSDLIMARQGSTTSPLTGSGLKAEMDARATSALDASKVELKSGRRNSLINARFAINQNVVSGTVVLAAGDFGHDMMFGGASGCTYTFSTTNNTTVLTISAGSIKQVVASEDVQQGLNVLSHVGTSQGRINGGSYGASGTVTATLTGATNVVCEWGIGTLSLIQLEKSSYATDFKYIKFNEDLSECQKYFSKSYDLATAAGTITSVGRLASISSGASSGDLNFNCTFSVRMRGAPAVTIYSPTSGTASRAGGTADIVAGVTSVGETNATVLNSGAIIDSAFYSLHYTANARITS